MIATFRLVQFNSIIGKLRGLAISISGDSLWRFVSVCDVCLILLSRTDCFESPYELPIALHTDTID